MSTKIKVLIIIVCIVAVIITGIIITMNIMSDRMIKILSETTVIQPDLSALEDGVYPGSFSAVIISVELNVTIKNHTITDIKIIKQSAGKGHEATEILDRVIQAQSLEVDAVTGATGSSKLLLIAIGKALAGE